MARRQYSSCRTVRRMGTFAPAWSQPSGQEFCAWTGAWWSLGDWSWCLHLNVRVGALRLWPAGQREGGDGAPPRGRRPTVVEVRTWVRGAEGCGNAENSSTGPGALAPDVWAASRAPDSNGREYSCGAAARHPTGPEVSRGPVIVGFRERYPMGDWEPPLRPPYSSLM